MELARELICKAKEGGGDLAKFQLFDGEVYPEVKDVALTKEQAFMLFGYGKEVGIEVFFSVYDVERVGWCEEMGVKRYKISCAQNKNRGLLKAVQNTNKPYLVSSERFHPISLKHPQLFCVPKYPASLDDLHLNNISFNFYEGFSDHTIGIDCAKIAIVRGCKILEKHFAVDHKTGVDAEWSMDCKELRELKRWEEVCKKVL